MEHRTYFYAVAAAGALFVLSGCMGEKSSKDDKVAIDDAKSASVPSKLRDKLMGMGDNNKTAAKTTDGIGADYIRGPLETELERLKGQADSDRQMLSKTQEQAAEFDRRTKETQESLKRTEVKIANIQKVMRMIDSGTLDRNPGLMTEATKLVPGLAESGPLAPPADTMPALGVTSPLAGGPSNGNDLQRNDLNFNSGAASSLAPSAPSLTPPAPASSWNAGKSLSPLTVPSFADGPELSENKAGVWSENAVPAVRPDGKILVCDGNGAGAEFIISLGKKDGLSEGTLFEATGANNEKNVLVVTKVYAANAEAKLHPAYAKGGLKEGVALHKLSALPE